MPTGKHYYEHPKNLIGTRNLKFIYKSNFKNFIYMSNYVYGIYRQEYNYIHVQIHISAYTG
jgi:hypothetical protein